MDWLTTHAVQINILLGACGAAWAFFTRLDKSYRSYLKEELASKSELILVSSKIDRLEQKLDDILLDSYKGRRYAKRKRTKTVA